MRALASLLMPVTDVTPGTKERQQPADGHRNERKGRGGTRRSVPAGASSAPEAVAEAADDAQPEERTSVQDKGGSPRSCDRQVRSHILDELQKLCMLAKGLSVALNAPSNASTIRQVGGARLQAAAGCRPRMDRL